MTAVLHRVGGMTYTGTTEGAQALADRINTDREGMPGAPVTPEPITAPLDAAHPLYPIYAEGLRWGYPGSPRPTFRQWLADELALTLHRERTGLPDPWPDMEDIDRAAALMTETYGPVE